MISSPPLRYQAAQPALALSVTRHFSHEPLLHQYKVMNIALAGRLNRKERKIRSPDSKTLHGKADFFYVLQAIGLDQCWFFATYGGLHVAIASIGDTYVTFGWVLDRLLWHHSCLRHPRDAIRKRLLE